MRRRKWKAPNNPTIQARQVWRAIYGEPWPKGWKVQWVGFMRGLTGLCHHNRRVILLNYADAKRGDSILHTLVHEFVHLRHGFTFRGPGHERLRHGKEFERLVEWGWQRLLEAQL